MKPQRAPFQPIGDMDDKLEQLAREKGVSTLVKPDQAEQGGNADGSRPALSAPAIAAPAPTHRPKQAIQATSEATPRSRMKTVNMELPDYVWTDLKIRAAHGQTSVRHLIMTALRDTGVHIAEADMIEDGRRLRGRDLRGGM